jgi:hypothetical protein
MRPGQSPEPNAFAMDPVQALMLCLRLGIKNVRFTPSDVDPKSCVSIYPFGGDPSHKAQRKQLRKQLAEHRRERSAHRALEMKIRKLETTEQRNA